MQCWALLNVIFIFPISYFIVLFHHAVLSSSPCHLHLSHFILYCSLPPCSVELFSMPSSSFPFHTSLFSSTMQCWALFFHAIFIFPISYFIVLFHNAVLSSSPCHLHLSHLILHRSLRHVLCLSRGAKWLLDDTAAGPSHCVTRAVPFLIHNSSPCLILSSLTSKFLFGADSENTS